MNPELLQLIQALPPEQRQQLAKALMGAQGSPPPSAPGVLSPVRRADELYSQGENSQLNQLGSAGDRNEMLQYQLQQAEALRKPSGQQHVSPWGAIFGGLGDAIGNMTGAYREKKIREQQQALIDSQESGRALDKSFEQRLQAEEGRRKRANQFLQQMNGAVLMPADLLK